MAEKEKEQQPEPTYPKIWVKNGREARPDKDGNFPVGAWEQHEQHPGGEAFVNGDAPVQVAATPFVNQRISRGFLEQVEAPAARPAEPPKGDKK